MDFSSSQSNSGNTSLATPITVGGINFGDPNPPTVGGFNTTYIIAGVVLLAVVFLLVRRS